MSQIIHTSKIELKGCRLSIEFQNKIDELITSLEKENSDEQISVKASFKIAREGETIETKSKKSEGLGDASLKIFDELEMIAQDLCTKGNDPSKIKIKIGLVSES